MGKRARRRVVQDDPGAPPAAQLANCQFDRVQIADPDGARPIIARRNLSTRQLERLVARGAICAGRYQAGDRYRSDWERAGFQQRTTASYDIVTAGGQAGHYAQPGGQTEAQMDAWDRWRAAREQIDPALVHGFDTVIVHDLLWRDVGDDRDRLHAFTEKRWVLAIRACLAQLAAFYQIEIEG
jgi:hypothetical protein